MKLPSPWKTVLLPMLSGWNACTRTTDSSRSLHALLAIAVERMKTEIILCDLCQKPLKGLRISRQMHGACLTIGYSIGGWGSRKNHVEWSGEICETCYAEYETIAKAVQLWLQKRAGIRAPEIIIREHNVSVVSADEPPSNGRETRLLR